jgi:hypothetical protein
VRSRTPSAKLILAEVEKRLAYLNRRIPALAHSQHPQEREMYREMLGAAAELEAVRNMIQYRRRSLITNQIGNDDSFPAVEVLHA